MKIENGVLYDHEGEIIASIHCGEDFKIHPNRFLFDRDECRQLASYLLEFSRSGKLQEPASECAKFKTCKAARPDGVCNERQCVDFVGPHMNCDLPTPKNEPRQRENENRKLDTAYYAGFQRGCQVHEYESPDQQPAQDKLCLWENAFIALLPLVSNVQASNQADCCVEEWLEARKRFGVR